MRRYDLTAEIYDARYREEQEAKYEAALGRVSIDGMGILDVGCGTGLLFDHIATKAEMTVGVDLAKRLLVQANERSRHFGNVYLVQADADHLPFKPGFFGVVFVFTVLQNLPKPSQTLLEIARTARLEACIVVTGLKKTLSLQAFRSLLENANLVPVCIIENEFLRCHVAVSFLGKKHVAGANSS